MFDGKNILLKPFAALYGGITGFRNFLYDKRILASSDFDIPVICVGNLSMGGTGKTPHTEYIANLLSGEHKVAVLSRGYKRKSSGFSLVEETSKASETGDEPLQIKMKHPHLNVAVDADRVRGVKKILERKPGTGVIILDDGFQHRSIRPGLSIILTSFSRPFTNDKILPYGSLRESINAIRRSDVVIVTKTPGDVSPISKEKIADKIRNMGVRNVFFTAFRYLEPVNAFNNGTRISTDSLSGREAIIVTGIADPEPFAFYLEKRTLIRSRFKFPDHHDFSAIDLGKISAAFNQLKTEDKIILTTEKDAVRLREIPDLSEALKKSIFYIPVSIDFPDGDREKFEKLIFDYARKNK